MGLVAEQRIQLLDRNIRPLLVHDEVHKLPRAASLVLSPKVSGELFISNLGGNLPRKTNATVVVDKHDVSRRHLLPPRFIHGPGNRSPHDKVRTVINLLQVFNLLGWQKSPDSGQGSLALDRILEMSLCGGISSSDYEKDLS